MGFEKIAEIEDLWSGEMRGLEVNGEHILLVNIDDRIYAYADVCPHQRSRLSEGKLKAGIIRCARHDWEFDVCTGCGVNPQNACLRAYPIKVDGQDILIDIGTGMASRTAERGGANGDG
jgi:toluene monooxygenase system ferredoxin subunit